MPNNKPLDDIFDDPTPPPVEDVHLRANSKPTQIAPMPEAPIVRPPRIKTTMSAQKKLATDMTVAPEIRALASDVVKIYTAGYMKAAKDFDDASEAYKSTEGHLALMLSGRADIAALEFTD